MLARVLRVQPIAFSRACSAGSSCTLLGTRLRNRRNHKRVHSQLRVVHLYFSKPRVHHVEDPIDSERGLRNVRCYHYLPRPRRGRVKDLRLQVRGQGGVNRQDYQLRGIVAQLLHPFGQYLAGRVDFLLSSQKEENIPGRLCQMNLEHCHQRCFEVVRFRLVCIQDLHWERNSWYSEDVAVIKVTGKLFSIQRGRGDYEFEIGARMSNFLHNSE